MRKPVVLVTGAGGEVGQGLISTFKQTVDRDILALDLNPIPEDLRQRCVAAIIGDILDKKLLDRLVTEYEIHAIYHLAAVLSTRSEYSPETAHRVNVEGTLNLLNLAQEQAQWHGHDVTFLFPSSIAVYGFPDAATKERSGRVREIEWNFPTTMYGCNKCYCEQLGRYYTRHFRQLAAEAAHSGVDFRSVRFPGLISGATLPSGGTSDYAAEMIHAAAQGQPYSCFVKDTARLPFMVMPDAIKALNQLAAVPCARLSQRVYNVASFSMTAGELRDRVMSAFPEARITFEPDRPRARIVDSWPGDVDDDPARQDWDWSPEYDADRAFKDYLIPTIAERYQA